MDAFYLKNKARYEKLVDSFDPSAPVAHFSRHGAAPPEQQKANTVFEECNPDMVVSARIRPMLDDDLQAGFPRAAYPRSELSGAAQAIDLHDLYHHPIAPPSLKVGRAL